VTALPHPSAARSRTLLRLPARPWALLALHPLLAEYGLVALLCILPDLAVYLSGHTYIGNDILTENIALKWIAIEQFLKGRLPLWTARLTSGMPLWADGTSLPLDWRNVWWLLFPMETAYDLTIASSRVVGALVCFAYFRQYHRFRFPAALAATFVYFCGTIFYEEGRLSQMAPMLEGAPAIFWLTERLSERPNLGRALAVAAGFALLFTMGSFAYMVYLPFLAFGWGAALWLFRAPRPSWTVLARYVLAFPLALAWGAALCAATFLPFIEFLSRSNRGGEYLSDPFVFRNLLFAFLGADASLDWVPGYNYFFYVGAISIPLIFSCLRRRDTPHLRALPWITLLSLVGIGLLLSPEKPTLVKILPVLATVSFLRVTFFWGFLASLFVGYALNTVEWQPGAWTRRVARGLSVLQLTIPQLAIIIAGLLIVYYFEDGGSYHQVVGYLSDNVLPLSVLLALTGLRASGLWLTSVPGGRTRPPLIAGLLLVELLVAWVFVPGFDPRSQVLYPVTSEVGYLKSHFDPNYRVTEAFPPDDEKPPKGFKKPPDTQNTTQGGYLSLLLNAQAVHGLLSANAYESVVSANYGAFIDDLGDLADRKRRWGRAPNAEMVVMRAYTSQLLDALAIRYIFTDVPLVQKGHYSLKLVGDTFYVYERKDPLPRAFFVSHASVLPTRELHAQLRALSGKNAPANVFKQTVFLTAHPGLPVGESGEAGWFVPANVARDEDSQIAVDVTAPRQGYLVLSDVLYPGWRAWVDGQEVPIEEANGFARAVAVSPGTHHVEYRFEPPSVFWGFRISGLAIVVSLGVAAWYVWRRRQRRAEAASGESPPRE